MRSWRSPGSGLRRVTDQPLRVNSEMPAAEPRSSEELLIFIPGSSMYCNHCSHSHAHYI